jgi:RNA polymerase sigma-70 factor (ECF subfamily)
VASDAQLATLARAGDVAAFGELAGRYERTLLALALAKLHDIHAAEDVVQSTLLRAFRQLHGLRDVDRFGPWLYAIAYSQTTDALRSRRIPVSLSPACDQIAGEDGDELRLWIEHEHLLNLVARLPDSERTLLGQRYFDGRTMAEISAASGRPIGTVTKQISRAVARLREWFEKGDLS